MQLKSVPFLKLTPIRPEVKSVIEDVMEKGVLMNGPYIDSFKSSFSKYLNLNHIIPTANCTDALEIVLRSIEIQENDEVITTSFSWFSDASVTKLMGAKNVFCEMELKHFGINVIDFERRITAQTKAVILPHLFGLVHPDIKKIASICSENNILLIEDCAQAHGATLDGQLAGTFGDVAVFSFYPTKNLGALGDAGAIATNDNAIANKCQMWTNHGQISRNEHLQLGRNSRMDELQAAVLSTKLAFLDSDNQRRANLATIYHEVLDKSDCILPLRIYGHVYHQFVIRTNRRDELRKFLNEKGIETDVHYPNALSDMKVFQSTEKYPNASLASNSVLSLPIHPNHSEEEIEFVAKNIKSFFRT